MAASPAEPFVVRRANCSPENLCVVGARIRTFVFVGLGSLIVVVALFRFPNR